MGPGLMRDKRPCPGIKAHKDTRYTEDAFVKHNPALVRIHGEDWLRDDHRRLVVAGIIPPLCPSCGWHHHPIEGTAHCCEGLQEQPAP